MQMDIITIQRQAKKYKIRICHVKLPALLYINRIHELYQTKYTRELNDTTKRINLVVFHC